MLVDRAARGETGLRHLRLYRYTPPAQSTTKKSFRRAKIFEFLTLNAARTARLLGGRVFSYFLPAARSECLKRAALEETQGIVQHDVVELI